MSGIKSRMKDYRRTPKHMVRLPKPASVAKRQLIELSDDEEDDISYQRHKKLLLQEHRKVHPNLQVVTELMRATYKRRHSIILREPTPISSILEHFPFLKKFEEVQKLGQLEYYTIDNYVALQLYTGFLKNSQVRWRLLA